MILRSRISHPTLIRILFLLSAAGNLGNWIVQRRFAQAPWADAVAGFSMGVAIGALLLVAALISRHRGSACGPT
jgi:steroid 5-alpha reductase family enzyme